MTPETRAARDRLARFADSDGFCCPAFEVGPGIAYLKPDEVTRVVAQQAELIRAMLAPDLRTVLAALDDGPTPAASETCGKRSRWHRYGGILGPCIKPPGHGTERHLDASGAAWDPASDSDRSAT